MLEELYLENFVLFETSRLRLPGRLTAISGETGAGKSLIAEALQLALGERATGDFIRQGAEQAVVSAVFLVRDATLAGRLAEAGFAPDEDGRLIFERVLRRDGRGRLSVNGRPAGAAAVRAAAAHLVDLAAQSSQIRLADRGYQRDLLDAYGRLAPAAGAFAELFVSAAALHQRLTAGETERERVRQKLADLKQDLDRLARAAIDPAEDARLEDRIRALSHADAIRGLADRGIEELYEGEAAIQDRLGGLQREAGDLAAACQPLAEATEHLGRALEGVEEAVRCLRGALESSDGEPGELEAAIERAESLKTLARRFGCGVAELKEKETELRREAKSLAGWESGADEARAALRAILPRTIEAGLALREKRAAAAKKLARAAQKELRDLGMAQAGFVADLRPLWNPGDTPEAILSGASERGLEEVEFRLAPNPGEAPSPLAETASGGEASRALLALKAALGAAHRPPVLFFDEIDTGVGGRLGDIIAAKLRELAADRQVVAITHLAQVAAGADEHWQVAKAVRGGRTVAALEPLAGESRVEEIAAMIAGAARTETTRQQAREMLGTAARNSPRIEPLVDTARKRRTPLATDEHGSNTEGAKEW